jgi:2-phospho-L-lactate guanylyltransferase
VIDPAAMLPGMQGTVATFDTDDRTGTVLLDDGTSVRFTAVAFDTSGLRLLRLGQRVSLHINTEGLVTRLRLPTMP